MICKNQVRKVIINTRRVIITTKKYTNIHFSIAGHDCILLTSLIKVEKSINISQ